MKISKFSRNHNEQQYKKLHSELEKVNKRLKKYAEKLDDSEPEQEVVLAEDSKDEVVEAVEAVVTDAKSEIIEEVVKTIESGLANVVSEQAAVAEDTVAAVADKVDAVGDKLDRQERKQEQAEAKAASRFSRLRRLAASRRAAMLSRKPATRVASLRRPIGIGARSIGARPITLSRRPISRLSSLARPATLSRKLGARKMEEAPKSKTFSHLFSKH